jgi:hypothetical protein
MKKPLITVIIANIVMTCTATAPVYSLSEGHINHWGLAVILGSMTVMNAVAGGGLSLFDVPEGKYFKWLAPVFFVLSLVFFLIKF